MNWDLDTHYLKSHSFSIKIISKTQIQRIIIKNPCLKKLKIKETKLIYIKIVKFLKDKNKKKKIKKYK